ncbi:MAG: hypothetical protein A2381_10480 [Bdellovibrionales bacterium RIFOXYB1_FULL_37_110]|nr:MAG: hypothetical protein A2417_05640 [Bdellovibrionales bacterium RIFOXYC1_FULL_37_79]OFZ61189.1 MAG: hypothetical protein A2381_10480 [Bdellovibrionales bacterium RIFOXYB1_FULL_37_110]OFZ65517.1 MAG: hypothetical protein A2577_01900 [Bdellovibrionales bacterium RIFOXYD1_FULL_36_51]
MEDRNYFVLQTVLIIFLLAGACAKQATVADIPSLPVIDTEVKENIFEKIPIREGPSAVNTPKVIEFCKKIENKFAQLGWVSARCEKNKWHHVRNSSLGNPLVWTVFGDENAHTTEKKDCTMFFCGVHGDETTTIKFCFDLIDTLLAKPPEYFNEKLVVVVPIVNPDGFFTAPSTRTNHRGVDINRNFPTKDWNKNALKFWVQKFKKNKRRFPGHHAMSEPETVFHVNIIKRYKPTKIVSLHSPLSFVDYDGPGDFKKETNKVGTEASNLLLQMSESSKKFRISNYPFFPGSLGNWAGNERDIPTYTLELPSSDPLMATRYWVLFQEAIFKVIDKDLNVLDSSRNQKVDIEKFED